MENLLSVIIPVYNTEQYLSKCLDSVINQTYDNLEIICVDDGSTDHSLSILNSYAKRDARIKVYTQNNSGQSVARNLGMSVAHGDFVTFIDSDDYLDHRAYEKSINKFTKNIDIVCFATEVITEGNAIKFASDDWYYSVHQQGVMNLTAQILLEENVSPCNKIYRLNKIKEHQIEFPKGLWYEDTEFYWKYLINCKQAYFIQEKLYKYIRRNHSVMATTVRGSDKSIDHLKACQNIIDYFNTVTGQSQKNLITQVIPILFESYFWLAYTYSSKQFRNKVLDLAYSIVDKYNLVTKYPSNIFINDVYHQRLHKYKDIDICSFWQRIFSIKKLRHYKYIYVLGLKFEVKRSTLKKLQRM